MSGVTLKNIEKIYSNGFKAVHGIDLEIKSGEFMVLVGPSGCAKSTMLRMIAGLEDITRGELWIEGKLSNKLPPKDRGIAMVFQNYALYPHMTTYENMAFGLKMAKFSKKEIDKRVRETAERLEISDILDRKPKEMSGGQKQRVALGRAIVREPKVFLFDEPLSNLDAKLRVSMRVRITQLHKELINKDWFQTLPDFNAYIVRKEQAMSDYAVNPEAWSRRTLINIAEAGFFSSDRTIKEYDDDIWHLGK